MNISFTKIQTFLSCPKKYYWSHVRRLESKIVPEYYKFGTSFHKGVEGIDDGTIAAYAGMKANSVFPKLPNEQKEQPIIVPLGDHTLLAVADLITDRDVVEYKTTSRGCAETVKAHQLSMQQRLYCKIFDRPDSRLRLCKKTAIRQKVKENDEEFKARQKEEYNNVEEHYLEVVTPDIDTEGVLEEVHLAIDSIQLAAKRDIWLKAAPYACYSLVACPFLDLCNDYDSFKHLFQEKTYDETLKK